LRPPARDKLSGFVGRISTNLTSWHSLHDLQILQHRSRSMDEA